MPSNIQLRVFNQVRLKVLRQIQIEPSNLVKESLNNDLFTALMIQDPPAVLFLKLQGDFSGFCSDQLFTEGGEIVIDEQLAGLHRSVSESVADRRLTEVFIHEYAHRLAPNHWHDAVFAATNYALMLRAQNVRTALSNLSHHFKIYDFADHQSDAQQLGLADAFRFIVEVGTELATSSLSAPEIADAAANRWVVYEADVLSQPARMEAEKRRQATAMSYLQHSLNDANQQKMDLFTYGVAAGCFFMLLALYVMKKFL